MSVPVSLRLTALLLLCAALAVETQPLPGTQPLTMPGDLAAQMVAGIDQFLSRETAASVARRAAHWKRDLSSHESYVNSVEPNRQRFLRIIGAVDPRETVEMQPIASLSQHPRSGEGAGYKIIAVRWNVLKGVEAEGLLLQPNQ